MAFCEPIEEVLLPMALPDWFDVLRRKKLPVFEFDFEFACMLALDYACMATTCAFSN